jgi:putative acetyltransferase
VKGAPAIVAVERGDRAALAAVRALFREYADALGIDLGFQGFAAEVGDLPGAYAAPRGALLLAGPPDAPAGCAAVRPLATPGDAELKRLYVRPAHRRGGLGRRLAVAAIEAARGAGHRRLVLDTLAGMDAARALYRSLGFVPVPAYYANPLPGAVYLGLALR